MAQEPETAEAACEGNAPAVMPFAISVCPVDEVVSYRDKGVTHLLSVNPPGHPTPTPAWFRGPHTHVFFADGVLEADARNGRAPVESDVREILEFGAVCLEASRTGPVHLLVHCTHGASRSPAAACAIAAQALGPGYEKQAVDYVINRVPHASPNMRVIAFADHLLQRKSRLFHALAPVRRRLEKEADELQENLKKPGIVVPERRRRSPGA